MTEAFTALFYGGRIYKVRPCFSLVSEIERELGGVAELARRFSQGRWSAGDLVALVQMMLQSAGCTADYRALGAALLRDGLARHATAAAGFLKLVLEGEGCGTPRKGNGNDTDAI